MSTAMTAMLLVMSMMMVGSADAGGLPTKIWDLYAVFNGVFDNSQRIDKGYTHHDFVNVYVRTANIPALSENPVIFIQVIENRRRTEFCQVVVPQDGPDNDLVLLAYNFTGNDKFNAATFDYNQFAKYTRDQFVHDPLCQAGLSHISPGTFVGQWPVCSHKINGAYPAWGVTFTCRHITASIPVFGDEVRNYIPYDMRLTGDKFPLVGAPADFVNPCDPNNKLCVCNAS